MSEVSGKFLKSKSVKKDKLSLVSPVDSADPVTKQYSIEKNIIYSTIALVRATNKSEFSDKLQIGDSLYKYDAADTTSTDNGNTVIKTLDGKVYKKIYSDVDPNYTLQINGIVNTRLAKGSVADLRNFTDQTLDSFEVTTRNLSGLFIYDPSDSTSTDDGVLVIKQGNRVFKRDFNGVVNAKWWGIVGDVAEITFPDGVGGTASNDETTKIQNLLDNPNVKNIYFEKSKYPYRINFITIPSDKHIVFEDGSVVFGLGKLTVFQRMVYLTNVNNVTIKGKVIFKDIKTKYPEKFPAINSQRHLFIMQGCNNIVIENVSANDSGGDGFYIGSSTEQNYCNNVKLINVTADNNKRQGLSLVSGKNIDVINSAFTGTKDDTPGAGIDIEPNVSTEFLQNIRIINTRTAYNEGGGLLIALAAMKDSLNPISIYVSGHYDYKSRYGFLSGYGIGICNGSVIVENSVWEENDLHSCVLQNYSIDFPKLTFKDCKSINANNSGSVAATYGTAIILYREANTPGSTYMGNVEFINPEVIETRAVKKVVAGIRMVDQNISINPSSDVKKCTIINPKFVGINDFNRLVIKGEVTVKDDSHALDFGVGNATRSFDWFSYAPFYHNGNSTTQVLVTLGNLSLLSPEVTFEARTSNQFIIRPSSGNNILPLSTVNGKGIYTTTIGSRITLQKKTANSWFIKEIIGTWVVEV